MQIKRVDTIACVGGEGPMWDPVEQVLHFFDVRAKQLHRYDPASGLTRSWEMPSVISALALRDSGGLVLTLRTGIFGFDPDSGDFTRISPLPDPPEYIFNDGKVDRRGRFIIGASTPDPKNPAPDGGLFTLGTNHCVHRLDSDIFYSNGPCWSPDDQVFYFSDSWRRQILAYDYDVATGIASNRRVFADTTDLGGSPDGATVDADGLIWVAIFGGGKIAAFRPDGCLERTVATPVTMPSSVIFGGPDLDRLYVTTFSHIGNGDVPEPGGGDLYVIDGLGARGLPEPRYAG